MNKFTLASLELLISTLFWGFGFVATHWALQSLDAVSLTTVRYGISFLLGFILLLILPQQRRYVGTLLLRKSMGPGILLGLMLVTQTWGLALTSVPNSGFITTLYVIFVPLIEQLFLKKRYPFTIWIWIIIALVGTGLLVSIDGLSVNLGDLLTLVCALFAAGQIVWVSQIQSQIPSAFAFNVFQCFWGCLASLLFYVTGPKVYFNSPNFLSILSFSSLVLGSTLLAFALQIRAQRILPAPIASLFFLLESPFALIFGIILLNERLGHTQILGAGLIFLACLGSTISLRQLPIEDPQTS